MLPLTLLLLPLLTLSSPLPQHKCTFSMKTAAIQAEIDTITSHTFASANKIPLAPTASRTFYVTPDETKKTLPPINVGVTAESVRAELVSLATFLNAKVPGNRARYVENSDGSVTAYFIQNDRFFLPHEKVAEIHEFNEECQITKITGTVHGDVVCQGEKSHFYTPVMAAICKEIEAQKGL